MPPPVVINPLTGSPNSQASWYPSTWGTANYSAPQVNYGASGVAPAGGMNLSNLTPYINTLNRQGQTAANAARIPNATGLETQSSGNISSELAGRVDPSTMRLLQQQAAERGVATGVGADSPNSNAAYLQALGLTSIGLEEQGQRDLSAALARNPAAPLFDPSTQLLTPYQSGQLSLEAQRLAQSGSSGGGYAPRIVGGAGGSYESPTTTYTTGPVDSGYDPSAAWETDPTAAWLSSIGATPTGFPGPLGIAGEQGRTVFDYGGYQQEGAVSPGSPAEEPPLNYSSIFGPDLNTLYGPPVSDLGPVSG